LKGRIVSQPVIHWTAIESAPFDENTYIAHLDGQRDCVVVDPGLEPGKILGYLNQHGLKPAAILITHGHSDHIAGNWALKDRYPDCPIVVSHGDAEKLIDPDLNLSSAFGVALYSPAGDVLVGEGDVYSAAGLDLTVREIPGHSTGHIVFVWHSGKPAVVFGGDVLFAGSIGRTDFPGCSFEQLAKGIWSKLFTLPDDTQVLPGHGPPTTIGQEKRTNPFVGAPAGFRG
jgi:glyoxylase-like metal-dependent hydrolase (beta-lactamase superfamily II)